MGDHFPVALVGVIGGEWFGSAAEQAVREAEVLGGSPRHLCRVPRPEVEKMELGGDVGAFLDQVIKRRDEGRKVCVLASGDPGFFGLARLAARRIGPGGIVIHPAPSSVGLAAARAATNWDDAVVVSAHGRSAEPVVDAVTYQAKVAVLCSPANPPETLGLRLLEAGCPSRDVTVASRLGEPDEEIWRGDVEGLAGGSFDALSVVLFACPDPAPVSAGWRWGRPDSDFEHGGGMITKAEVRAVALGKLGLVPAGVMWDVGAGSGSVACECAGLAPGLRIFAIEKDPQRITVLRHNAQATSVVAVSGCAPEALASLPDPDRVFIGGGGLEVLDAVMERLRPGGNVVATYVSVDRAVAAAARLGHMVQVAVSRAVPIGPDGTLRLAAENPVFVCWGPRP
ncbi:MAG: precorrin-6y C5,15-methyltransferase (decarboxylating) subunit CbiE [Acidimicrobiales bacterium]|nr:precorrin-6y C5,15-methyltransferase (decarboxylating) subunit CbiE [Acidimicrobiales bacterium]